MKLKPSLKAYNSVVQQPQDLFSIGTEAHSISMSHRIHFSYYGANLFQSYHWTFCSLELSNNLVLITMLDVKELLTVKLQPSQDSHSLRITK